MRFFVYVSLLIALVPLFFSRPFFGLCIYYVVSLLQPKILCWRGDFQDAMIVGVPLVLGAITVGVKRRMLLPKIDARSGQVAGAQHQVVKAKLFELAWPLAALFFLLLYIAANRAISPFPMNRSTEAFRALCKVFLVTALLTGMAVDHRRFRQLYIIVALSVAFWAIKGGFKVLALGPHQVYGKTYDNNLFALTSVMVLPMVFYHAMTVRRARWRYALFASSALIILAVIGSQSRAGFVALAFVVACMAWTSRYRFRALGAVAMAAVLTLYVSKGEIKNRIDSIIAYRADESARSRFGTWDTAMQVWSEHLLFGVGFNQYQPAARAMFGGKREAHNIFLQNLTELGLIGHPFWLAIVLGVPLSLLRFMHHAKRLPAQYRWAYYWARGLLLGLIAFSIHGFFHNEEFLELMITMFGLAVALQIMTRRVLAEDGLALHAEALQAAESNVRPVRPPRRIEPGSRRPSIWSTPLPATR